MARLVSVKGPHARGPQDHIRIQWNMGNSCNYSCQYCPPILHDGSKPWLNTQLYIDTIDKISTHYNALQQRTDYELIGGEVTVIPGFEDIIRKISEYNATSTVFTNASRTVEWWSKAREYMNSVVLTYHPLTQQKEHFEAVINEIKDHIHVSVNIAGVGGQIEELGEWAEHIRDMFKDCDRNPYYNVNICVKTMYKKLLGRHSKQETYWEYSDSELEVLRRPGIKPRPMPQKSAEEQQTMPQEKVDPVIDTSSMTEFLYEDGTAKYVQSHQIINEGLNAFKGMLCHLGHETLNIDANGDIISSWCNAVHFGNISDIDNWALPESYTECPFDYCNNISDIAISKTR